jgi:hypothetical protein
VEGTSTRCILALAGLPKSSSSLHVPRMLAPTAVIPLLCSIRTSAWLSLQPAGKHQTIDDKRLIVIRPRSCWHVDTRGGVGPSIAPRNP